MRLQSDERLVALARRGNHGAFEALVGRYQARLLSFCRHMLSSREDAEDVLQEVFAASFHAMLTDDRPINVRPWLYRIARNRSLNHLRRHQAIGQDSMDVHLADHGTTTADRVQRREEFRQLVGDVQELAETQRTALLLREIDALSYNQIAEAMETTVPSVKSLLVRARVSLAEASEARQLTCEEVRDELGEVSEGLRRITPPVRRHARQCDRCATFRKQLRSTNRQLAVLLPVAPLLFFKKLFLAHLGTTASAGGATAAGGVMATTAAAGGAGSLSVGIGAIASKTAAGLAAAAIVTAGAVEVEQVRSDDRDRGVQAATEPRAPSPAAPGAAPPSAAASIPVAPTERRTSRGPARDERPVRREQRSEDPATSRTDVEKPTTMQAAPPVAEVPAPVTKPPGTTTGGQTGVTGGGTSVTQPGGSEPSAATGPAKQQDVGEPVRASGSSSDGGAAKTSTEQAAGPKRAAGSAVEPVPSG
ncbi:MAG TPA: sigma-70 family RNA polymerase sigma factor [Solirubrobacteraceae bacterium]|nr:sigma-70 family RNA polymerase sigma factor [Solirubrobacteraceae bacterium]